MVKFDWDYIAKHGEEICDDFFYTFEKYVCDKKLSIKDIRYFFDILGVDGEKFLRDISSFDYGEYHSKVTIKLDRVLGFDVKVHKVYGDKFIISNNWSK